MRCLQKDTSWTEASTLNWTSLTPNEYEALLKTVTFDVDYLSLFVDTSMVDKSSLVRHLFSNQLGKFYHSIKISKLRGHGSVALLGQLGNMQVGICLEGLFEENGEEEEPFDVASSLKIDKNAIESLNSRVKDLIHNSIPYRDFIGSLIASFPDRRACFFHYGQKQAMDDFAQIVPFIDSYVDVDIAVALEAGLDDKVIYAEHLKGQQSGKFFSQLLSKNVGCFESRNPLNNVENSFQYCFYNTSHHKRKHIKKDISVTKMKTNTDQNLSFWTSICSEIERIADETSKASDDIYRGNKARFEVYIHAARGERRIQLSTLVALQEKLLQGFGSYLMTACKREEVIGYVRLISNALLIMSREFAKNGLQFTLLYILIAVFKLYQLAVFGCIHLSMAALKSLRGFGLPAENFESTLALERNFLLSVEALRSMLSMFKVGKKNLILRGILCLLYLNELFSRGIDLSKEGTIELRSNTSRNLKALFESIF